MRHRSFKDTIAVRQLLPRSAILVTTAALQLLQTVPAELENQAVLIPRVYRLYELGETENTVAACATNSAALNALNAGQIVLLGDTSLLKGLPVDIVVTATGIPTVDAQVAMNAIAERKHVCMVGRTHAASCLLATIACTPVHSSYV